MAFSEFEKRRYEKAVARYVETKRPPAHIRPELDLGYKLEGQSVEIFEIRPLWDNQKKKIEEAVAKATYVKSKRVWKVLSKPCGFSPGVFWLDMKLSKNPMR